ncbi:MAG: hypothetical protein ACI376_00375 [Candidatus Bruticola sp.]
MNYKYIGLGLLLSGALLLSAPSFAGVTDVTGGSASTVYNHTYHTNVKGTADISKWTGEYRNDSGKAEDKIYAHSTTVIHESGFVTGNISDSAVQAEIAAYNSKVATVIAGRTITGHSRSTSTTFDHFESSIILDMSKDAILVGDVDNISGAYAAQGTTTSTLDVHEYQVYQINESYTLSPIILDLDGDGKIEASNGEYLSHAKTFKNDGAVLFDFLNNGFPVLTEWVGANDGLLCRVSADGSMTGANFFGNTNGYANGYDEMSSLDANNDGVLSGAELEGLYVWQDRNGNGIADKGELASVQELGITSIGVTHNNMVGTYVRNGQTFKSFDWWPSIKDVRRMDTARL